MGKDAVKVLSRMLYSAGLAPIILALRGDPPREKEKWEATEGGAFCTPKISSHTSAKTYGSHFDIGVAGYRRRDAHDQNDPELLLDHVKQKG